MFVSRFFSRTLLEGAVRGARCSKKKKTADEVKEGLEAAAELLLRLELLQLVARERRKRARDFLVDVLADLAGLALFSRILCIFAAGRPCPHQTSPYFLGTHLTLP